LLSLIIKPEFAYGITKQKASLTQLRIHSTERNKGRKPDCRRRDKIDPEEQKREKERTRIPARS